MEEDDDNNTISPTADKENMGIQSQHRNSSTKKKKQRTKVQVVHKQQQKEKKEEAQTKEVEEEQQPKKQQPKKQQPNKKGQPKKQQILYWAERPVSTFNSLEQCIVCKAKANGLTSNKGHDIRCALSRAYGSKRLTDAQATAILLMEKNEAEAKKPFKPQDVLQEERKEEREKKEKAKLTAGENGWRTFKGG